MPASPPRPPYLPQLDGLRGYGMLLVIFAHLPLPSNARPLALIWRAEHAVKLADIALDAFFVMSGFLITRLLLAERRRTGRISLRAFYLRRVIRIFPIYYLCVLVVSLAWPTTLERTASLVFYAYNLYLPFHPVPYPLEQSWSLAVEEQFYMLWPLLLILLPPRWLGRTTLVLLPVAALLSAIAYAALLPPTTAAGLIYMSLPTRMLPLALGCYLATVEQNGGAIGLRAAGLASLGGGALLATAVLGRQWGLIPPGGWYWTLILPGVTCLAVGFIVVLVSPAAPAWLIRTFSHPVPRFLGRISYAAYLVHIPILFALGINDAALDGRPAPWERSALVVVLSLLLATASWYGIEGPLTRLKSRLRSRAPTPVSTQPGHPSRL